MRMKFVNLTLCDVKDSYFSNCVLNAEEISSIVLTENGSRGEYTDIAMKNGEHFAVLEDPVFIIKLLQEALEEKNIVYGNRDKPDKFIDTLFAGYINDLND